MTLSEVDSRFSKYRNKGLLIDTNLLLLYLIGEINPRLIPAFNRTRQFVVEDFTSLKRIITFFSKLITLPGILTEVSNLAGNDLKGDWRDGFFAKFAECIHLLSEAHVASAQACGTPAFAKFGLTDSAIILAGKDQYLTITTDAALAGYMERNQLDVINFNNIRLLNWT